MMATVKTPLVLLFSFLLFEQGLSFECRQTRNWFVVNDFNGKAKTEKLERRSFLSASFVFGLMGVSAPQQAIAAYGAATNIELPSYIDFLIEKNNQIDSSAYVYKGVDPELVFKRLVGASLKLGEIPRLAGEKKWSQVQGILTGPLGTLGQTLNQVAKDGSPEVQAAAKRVKSDVVLIGQATQKKSEQDIINFTSQTQADLDSFLRLVFDTK